MKLKPQNSLIKIGYLLSYDYRYILTSLKFTYAEADKIVICYDRTKNHGPETL